MAKITLKDLSHSYLTKQSNDADWALRGVDINWKDGGAYTYFVVSIFDFYV